MRVCEYLQDLFQAVKRCSCRISSIRAGRFSDRLFMTAEGQAHAIGPGFQQIEGFQVVVQPCRERQVLRRLVRAGLFQHMIAGEKNIMQADDHMPGAVPGNVQHFERTQAHAAGFVGKIHLDRVVQALGEQIHLDQFIFL